MSPLCLANWLLGQQLLLSFTDFCSFPFLFCAPTCHGKQFEMEISVIEINVSCSIHKSMIIGKHEPDQAI